MLLFKCKIKIVLLSVFLNACYFPAKSLGSERKCFVVEAKVLCYFSPNATTTVYSWEEASKECRENGATLPDLPDKVIAGVLERYLESQKVDYRFWTSGRRIESEEWRWIDGQPYSGKAVVKRYASDRQAVLRRDFTYLAQNPDYEKNFICQHFGSRCESGDAIRLSHGCLVLSNKELRNVSFARNSCLERGGDLPLIRDSKDLKKFEEAFSQLKDHAQIWVGLRRQWWSWRGDTRSADVQFSNWAYREGARLYNDCMVVDADSFKWRQVNCSDEERLLCQTVVPEKALYENDVKSSSMGGLVAGILIGVLIVVVAVIIAVLILRKRIRLPFDGFRRVKCVDSPLAKPYETQEISPTPASDVKASTSATARPVEGHYTGLYEGREHESAKGHYDKLNHRKVESCKSHYVEPCQRPKVDSRQSRKSEPCQGYEHEPYQGPSSSTGRGVEPSKGQNIPRRQSQKDDLDQVVKVEPWQGQGVETFQGQMADQYQDHYAKIAADQGASEEDEQLKTIVYAKLDFDSEPSGNSNDQHPSADNPTSPTGGSHSNRISKQTSTQSSKGPERLSVADAASAEASRLRNDSQA